VNATAPSMPACTGAEATIPTGYIINHHRSSRIADVTGDEAAESFLAGRIPKLQPNLWPTTNSVGGTGGVYDPDKGSENRTTTKIKANKLKLKYMKNDDS